VYFPNWGKIKSDIGLGELTVITHSNSPSRSLVAIQRIDKIGFLDIHFQFGQIGGRIQVVNRKLAAMPEAYFPDFSGHSLEYAYWIMKFAMLHESPHAFPFIM
jgi:hypothetical protein